MNAKMPRTVYLKKLDDVRDNGVYETTKDLGDKYHHDRIHQAVLDENKRLRDALSKITKYGVPQMQMKEIARNALKGQDDE